MNGWCMAIQANGRRKPAGDPGADSPVAALLTLHQWAHAHRSPCLAAVFLLLAGCSQVTSPPSEASLAEQAAAVRAGHTQTIRLEITPIADADLSVLEGLINLRELVLEQGSVSANGL